MLLAAACRLVAGALLVGSVAGQFRNSLGGFGSGGGFGGGGGASPLLPTIPQAGLLGGRGGAGLLAAGGNALPMGAPPPYLTNLGGGSPASGFGGGGGGFGGSRIASALSNGGGLGGGSAGGLGGLSALGGGGSGGLLGGGGGGGSFPASGGGGGSGLLGRLAQRFGSGGQGNQPLPLMSPNVAPLPVGPSSGGPPAGINPRLQTQTAGQQQQGVASFTQNTQAVQSQANQQAQQAQANTQNQQNQQNQQASYGQAASVVQQAALAGWYNPALSSAEWRSAYGQGAYAQPSGSLLAGPAPVLVPTPAPQPAHQWATNLQLRNKCTATAVRALVHIKDAASGEWKTVGWVALNQGATTTIGSTPNRVFYVYAEERSGRDCDAGGRCWRGKAGPWTFQGKQYGFQQVTMPESVGSAYVHNVEC